MRYDLAPKRGFTLAEYEKRLYKAQKLMLSYQIDALFLTSPSNFRYFSGFDSQFWESPTRPWYLIVPLKGKPIAVIPEIGASAMKVTWLEDIRTWSSPNPKDDGVSLLKSTLAGCARRFGRIGAEFGREMSIRMPVLDLLELRKIISSEMVDGSPMIWELRMIKTAAEVNHIEYICKLVSDAFHELPEKITIGETEREAALKLRIDILRRGADSTPFLPAISGRGGVSQIVCGPSNRVLDKGDILFIDTGSTYDGYFCDFDRNFAISKVSSEAARVNDLLWRATEAGITAAVPGASTKDIWLSMNKVIEEEGKIGNNVGRLGHGVGLQLTEPPSLRIDDNTLISENMVLTIEPGIEYQLGKMIVHEENIVVTQDGAKLLTKRAPRDIPVIN